MKLLLISSIIINLLDKFHALLLYRRNKYWHQQRLEQVRQTLTCPDGPLSEYPYIEHGTYHWQNVKESVALDLVFHELPLAIIVTKRFYGKYTPFTSSKKTWEAYMKQESRNIHYCKLANFPLLVIQPNDPINQYSLSLAIGKLVGQQEE